MIYLILFLEFFKIGLFTFGGGYAMIPLIEETVIKHGWLSEETFYNLIGICESTPGPIAVNMSTFVGSQEAGLLGAICSTLGVVLPSFFIIILVAKFLSKFINNSWIQAALSGIKPVIIGLIISTGIILLTKCIFTNYKTLDFDIRNTIIFTSLSIIYLTSKFIIKKPLKTIPLIILSSFLGLGIYMI